MIIPNYCMERQAFNLTGRLEVDLVPGGFVQPVKHDNTLAAALAKSALGQRCIKQYTGGTVPSFCHFCKIALKPSNDAAFSLFYLHQATHSFIGLEAFLGHS